MAKVLLKEARKIILSGEVVDLVWTTADENRRDKPSRRIEAQNLQICGSNHSDKEHATFTVKQAGKVKAHPITIHWDLLEKINGDEILI
jgi:hypothetical protein